MKQTVTSSPDAVNLHLSLPRHFTEHIPHRHYVSELNTSLRAIDNVNRGPYSPCYPSMLRI